ncbi:MAG: aspartate aminotransferase family protein [Planctomycetes bacterium]|jgi:glutamate-1-semialdehyde 2,1-aminomutase|nr:aspartate aminotransferase family protein [Planctomycetota bacterium]HJO26855.1 glutamate-1-semialdehyde 2,1-aminomutase [Planctomycetota bacterium]
METRPNSAALFARARALMPGGVSSPVRAFRSVGGTPIYFERASGSRFWDADGNEFVDFCLSWGPLILGHAHPRVVQAVQETAADGLSFGACCAGELELASRIIDAFAGAAPRPAFDQVRFVSSGTEAVMTALRLARGATSRPLVLKFDGGYHGHSDSLLVKAGSGLATLGTSSSLGVSPAVAADTLVIPLDDDEALENVFREHGARLAAAIIEPLPANNGLLPQRQEWLARLRALCTKHGALLIFDEVITGFRLAYGGYGDSLGIGADLVTLGKIIGGGMPVGALVGPRDLMEQLAPEGGVYQAGTLSGNPVGLAAGCATLDCLAEEDAYAKLETLGRVFDRSLGDSLAEFGGGEAALAWRREGSLIWLHLSRGSLPRAAGAIDPASAERYAPLHRALLAGGQYLAPSAYEVTFLSTAHSPEEVHALARSIARHATTLDPLLT